LQRFLRRRGRDSCGGVAAGGPEGTEGLTPKVTPKVTEGLTPKVTEG
jgi:hypothetical protein